MSKEKYLVETMEAYGEKCYDLGNSKEVEVLDYQKAKQEYEDSIFPSFIDFARSKNYLIVKIVE